jgi:deoxyribodipyrimidine photolyase-related protein
MYLMESFYRYMRKKHDVLMKGENPVHGQWNFDADNRKKLPKGITIPTPLTFDHNVEPLIEELSKATIKTIGDINAKCFEWPIDRAQSIALLDFFITQCLPKFGTYQDAMTPDEWSLYHSRLSFSMNVKLLSPLEVIERAIEAWKSNPKEIDYNQVEGFVRQILGWREYMRGIYWLKMPDYASLNFFNHQATLPNWYWTGNTNMNCLKQAIDQSLTHAYAHHIQRLMITGNFALLAGVHPDEVDAWYLGIYIDAIEWVEITNTRGMSQFAEVL